MKIVKTDRFDDRAYKNALDIHEELPALEESGEEKVEGWSDLQNDFFQEHYQANPETVDRNRLNSLFHNVVESVRDTQEYRDLRHYTESDIFNSAIATNIVGNRMLPEVTEKLAEEMAKQQRYKEQLDALEAASEAYARQLKKKLDEKAKYDKKNPPEYDQDGEQTNGFPGQEGINKTQKIKDDTEAHIQAILQQAEAELPDPNQPLPKDLDDALAKIRMAFREGAEEAIPILSFLSEAGTNYGLGGQGSPLELKKRVAEKVMGSRKLKELFEMAGRIRDIAMAKETTKIKARSQQIIGVEIGRDLDRVLPLELALAGVPALKPLFFKKFADKALQLYEMEAKRELGGGPIILLIDGSGSMMGPRELWSKAVMLAFLQLAKRDHRDVYVMQFSHQASDARTWKFTYRDKPDLVDWELLLDACETFINGGTDFKYPLAWAATVIDESLKPGAPPADCAWERADIVVLTDGEANIDLTWKEKWKAIQEKLRFHSFAVLFGLWREPECFKGVIDKMCILNDLQNDDKALEMLFASSDPV